ncbi:MAG: hypothetical protein F4X65_12450 [Chloroflexi bacterium]|nr:hypothetical protein [Chloroflexota bacterium]
MVRYWVIAPYSYDPRHILDAVWDWSFTNGLITIGWHELGNLSGVSKAVIRKRFLDEFDQEGYQSLQRFWHDIEVGDRVIARGGLKRIVGVGTVAGKPEFDLELGKKVTGGLDDNIHPNFIKLNWLACQRQFPNSAFRGHLKTVSELKNTQKHWPEIRNALREVWQME